MKKVRSYRIFFIAAILISIACAVLFFLKTPLSSEREDMHGRVVKNGWYYLDKSKRVDVELPAKISFDGELTLYNDNIGDCSDADIVYTKAAVYDVGICVDGKEVYRYENRLGRNPTVLSNIVCIARLGKSTASPRLEMSYSGSDGSYNIPEISVGTYQSVLYEYFLKYAFSLTITMLITGLGVIGLVMAKVTMNGKFGGGRIIFAALFLLFVGVWCFTDSPYIQLLSGYSDLVTYINFYAFMFLPLPMVQFVASAVQLKNNKILSVLTFAFFVNAIAQSLLAAFKVLGFFDMLFVTHSLILVFIATAIPIIGSNYRKKPSTELKVCQYSMIGVGVIGGGSILFYVLFNFSQYQLVFQTGVLVMVVVLLKSLVEEYLTGLKYRNDAEIYKTLAEFDGMTRMRNRRAFDLLLEDIKSGKLAAQNAALIYADVNNLKVTNDKLGHEAGDRLIIAAADSIRNAYGSEGLCFRVGGDEFCVVVINPVETEEQLVQRLKSAADENNQTTDVSLSIACGCSFLVQKGIKKGVSEWQAQADKKMYADKMKTKALV